MERKINWKYYKDHNKCAAFVGKEISRQLKSGKDRPTLLLLSGGSALSVLDHIENDDWKSVTVTMLDERFEEDGSHNNFSQLESMAWFAKVIKGGCKIISTKIQTDDTQASLTERMDSSLRKWKNENPAGKIMAIFGIGADGHTAGIFPFPENQNFFQELFAKDSWVVGYDASGKNEFPFRVTTTLTLHRLISHGYAFVIGEEKRAALQKLRQHSLPLNELPANIFYEMADMTIVTNIKF